MKHLTTMAIYIDKRYYKYLKQCNEFGNQATSLDSIDQKYKILSTRNSLKKRLYPPRKTYYSLNHFFAVINPLISYKDQHYI